MVLASSGNTGNGTNDNDFSYSDVAGNTYWRKVGVEYNVITHDTEGGSLAHEKIPNQISMPHEDTQVVVRLPGGRHDGI